MDYLRRSSEPRYWYPKVGTEGDGFPTASLLDFWQWGYWDILVNTNRSVFAEFIVASALKETHRLRREWEEYDILYKERKIEVKSSAYLQSWPQKGHSKIIFDIAKRKKFNNQTGKFSDEAARWAECYIFCLYAEKKSKDLDHLLDPARWKFFIALTEKINERFGSQKKAGCTALKDVWIGPIQIGELKNQVNKILQLSSIPQLYLKPGL